jgi:dinuclear metal center YbgI/SA1388 family protein
MKKKITINEILHVIHNFAPPALASNWDNVGLMLGDAQSEAKKILLCLDVTPHCVETALKNQANVIISHHPLLFKPLNKITNPLLLKLIKNEIAVISAHTNLDITRGGVNHKLAEIFDLRDLEILSVQDSDDFYHLAVYVPSDHVYDLSQAVSKAGGGRIGNYSHCANSSAVMGHFKPLSGSAPYYGEIGRMQQVDEVKLEFFADGANLDKVKQAIKKAHPYETPVYAVYPLAQKSPNNGLGVIGSLAEHLSISDFARIVKEKLDCPCIKVWLANRSQDDIISRIALCGGSGGQLISAVGRRADLFLSGEFGYHNMLESRIPLIEAGHFQTEYPVLQVLKELLIDSRLEIEIQPPYEHETATKMLYL